MVGDDAGKEFMPVWPHRRYAEACAQGEWSGAEPTPIDLDRWLEAWLPGMIKDGVGVAVFPIPNGPAVPVRPERLRDDLLEELAKYG